MDNQREFWQSIPAALLERLVRTAHSDDLLLANTAMLLFNGCCKNEESKRHLVQSHTGTLRGFIEAVGVLPHPVPMVSPDSAPSHPPSSKGLEWTLRLFKSLFGAFTELIRVMSKSDAPEMTKETLVLLNLLDVCLEDEDDKSKISTTDDMLQTLAELLHNLTPRVEADLAAWKASGFRHSGGAESTINIDTAYVLMQIIYAISDRSSMYRKQYLVELNILDDVVRSCVIFHRNPTTS
jgi:hypothetical protein